MLKEEGRNWTLGTPDMEAPVLKKVVLCFAADLEALPNCVGAKLLC
jgi:hypothetical protein